jgi:3-polyprenyl-4-hydroxybenzoate decarboxylase
LVLHHQEAGLQRVTSVDEVAKELGSLMKAKPPTSLRETIKLLGTSMDLRQAKPKLVKVGPCKVVSINSTPRPLAPNCGQTPRM